VPSVTTSSITRVEGFDEAWNGDLLIGTLTDMSLQRVRMEGDRAVYAERIPVGTRVRYVHQHTDGRIVLWTDNEELIFLESRPLVDEHAELEDFLDDRNIPAGIKARVRASIDRCSECHSFRADQHDRSPGLGRIFSADIASTSFESYSQALRDRQGRWTKENLTAFLSDPERFAPGTLMPNPQIADPQTTEVIVEYLKVRRTRF
jgi:cytochrome c2